MGGENSYMEQNHFYRNNDQYALMPLPDSGSGVHTSQVQYDLVNFGIPQLDGTFDRSQAANGIFVPNEWSWNTFMQDNNLPFEYCSIVNTADGPTPIHFWVSDPQEIVPIVKEETPIHTDTIQVKLEREENNAENHLFSVTDRASHYPKKQTAVSICEASLVEGPMKNVRYVAKRGSWRVRHKSHDRCFSARKHGYNEARDMAIQKKKEWINGDNLQGISKRSDGGNRKRRNKAQKNGKTDMYKPSQEPIQSAESKKYFSNACTNLEAAYALSEVPYQVKHLDAYESCVVEDASVLYAEPNSSLLRSMPHPNNELPCSNVFNSHLSRTCDDNFNLIVNNASTISAGSVFSSGEPYLQAMQQGNALEPHLWSIAALSSSKDSVPNNCMIWSNHNVLCEFGYGQTVPLASYNTPAIAESAQQVNRSNATSNEEVETQRGLADPGTLPKGVRYDSQKKAYRVVVKFGKYKKDRSFSVNKFGRLEALRQAVSCILSSN